jgi:non-ribosomal peptide synthase protein (TIGR01720 family)
MGYGVLKYLAKEESLQGTSPWDIVFNYLGQLDTATRKQALVQAADEPIGPGRGSEQLLRESLVGR